MSSYSLHKCLGDTIELHWQCDCGRTNVFELFNTSQPIKIQYLCSNCGRFFRAGISVQDLNNIKGKGRGMSGVPKILMRV